jgi:nucleotide-binding universal stress UspA family protein
MKSHDVRPIVCGTDFSGKAEQAANVAAALAARLGTTLVLVHGVDERGEFPQVYGPQFAEEARPHLDKEQARLRRLGADVHGEVATSVLDGGVARFAERADARLIVVGASGTGMLDRMIGIGSVSERIAETAWVPTLVVQDSAPFSSWFDHQRALRIFVGADFSPVSEAVLQFVRELSEVEPCKITVGFVDLHATERGEQAVRLSPNAPPAPEMQRTPHLRSMALRERISLP